MAGCHERAELLCPCQVADTESLQAQLKEALNSNNNLTRLYQDLDERLVEAYSALEGTHAMLITEHACQNATFYTLLSFALHACN